MWPQSKTFSTRPALLTFQPIAVRHCFQFHANGVGHGDERAGFEPEGRQHRAEQRAAELQVQLLGQENIEALKSRGLLGWVLQREGRDSEAERLLREVLEIRRRVLGNRKVAGQRTGFRSRRQKGYGPRDQ